MNLIPLRPDMITFKIGLKNTLEKVLAEESITKYDYI